MAALSAVCRGAWNYLEELVPPPRSQSDETIKDSEEHGGQSSDQADPQEISTGQLVITESALADLRAALGRGPAEQGGMLGGSRDDGVVRYFHVDTTARQSGATYSPDVTTLNALLRDDWNPGGIFLLGFAHSHPAGCVRPSNGDRVYAERILDAIPELDRLLLPIVQTETDTGEFTISAHAAVKEPNGAVVIVPLELMVIDDETAESSRPNTARTGASADIQLPDVLLPVAPAIERRATADPISLEALKAINIEAELHRAEALPEMFDRVREAYDVPMMATTRVVVVGVGGAAAFVDDLARAGVGEFVLIDPDVIEEPNLATQQVYRRDLGKPKVIAVAERIHQINPNAKICVVTEGLTDEIDDAAAGRLLLGAFPAELAPTLTLICGCTDTFRVQARVSRLALQFGLPMLAAQVYVAGRGIEVSFTAPGWTSACGRCVLGGRYRSFLDEAYVNTVTSHGTPIFATTRLNALKGMVALAIIHGCHPDRRLTHPATQRWAGLLAQIGHRNLIQVRLDPDIATTVGLNVFDRVLGSASTGNLLFDEAVWLPQQPEAPWSDGRTPCPDCGGHGDLRPVAGTITDTRELPTSSPDQTGKTRRPKPPRKRVSR